MQKFQDIVLRSDGRPAVGAAVTVTTSTGAAATLYSGNGTGELPSNVVRTDSSGEYSFYAANGRYNIAIAYGGFTSESKTDVVLFDMEDDEGFLQAGTGAAGRSVRDKLRDFVSVKDFGAKGDGATDDTAAIQAAVNAADAIYFPVGVYKVSGTIAYSGSRSKRITGASIGRETSGVQIVQYADADVFAFSGGSTLTCSDLSLIAAAAMSSGVAIRLESNNSQKLGLTAERLLIAGAGASDEFRRGIYTNNANSVRISDALIKGRTSSASAMNAMEFYASAGSSTVYNVQGVEVYDCDKALSISNTHNLGVEGVKLVNCDFVGVRSGVEFLDSSTYSPPHLLLLACHINASQYGVYATNISQVFLLANSIYMSGADSEAVHLENVTPAQVVHNQIAVIGSGDCTGINLLGNNSGGHVAGNYLTLKAGTSNNAINIGAGQSGVAIKDNHAFNPVRCVSDGSAAANINFIDNNFRNGAFDDAYFNPTVTSSAGVIDVRKVKLGGYATLLDSGTTITGLTGMNGQQITMVCNSAVTFEHNAGLLLKGGTNYAAVAGNTITLFKEAGSWREIARTA